MIASPPIVVHVISHTHWDREWYHPAGVLRQRLVTLIDELLADPPERAVPFLLDGQAVVLEDYLAVRPERRDELGLRLRRGLLEAGPWYVLGDELIPSGEALVRNLLTGRLVLAGLGATAPPVVYSPDAFGHPAALPLLATGFGYGLVMLWRGLGGELWPPGDSFVWRGPDGSTVLVHHLPRDGYEYGANLPSDPDAARDRWQRLWRDLAPRARLGVMLVLNGADHHARQEGLDTAVAALTEAAAPVRVEQSSLGRFGRDVQARASQTATPLPVIDGELRASYGYTWVLPGTLAARAHLKRRNARVERLLEREAEPWTALAAWRNARVRGVHRALLQAAWKALLLCHPHDTLCGCVTDEVARAMEARLDDAESQAGSLRDRAIWNVVGHDPVAARTTTRARWRPTVLVQNRAAYSRSGVAELEVLTFRQDIPVGPGSGGVRTIGHPGRAFTLLDGVRELAHQLLERSVRHDRIESPRHYPDDDLVDVGKVVAWVSDVEGYEVRPVSVVESPGPPQGERSNPGEGRVGVPQPVTGRGTTIENALLRLEVCAAGDVLLTTIDTPPAARPPVVIPSLLQLEDVRDGGDLYTPSLAGPTVRVGRCMGAELVHAGPLRAEVRARYLVDVPDRGSGDGERDTTRAGLPVEVAFTLDAGAHFVRVRVRGDNSEPDHRLRIRFSTGVVEGEVFADAAFGPVRRDRIVVSEAGCAMERPLPTAPLHRYVTLADGTRGVTIYSDGLAEYEATEGGDVAVTLVRAVGQLSRNDLPERPGHAGWPVATPEAQCLGPFAAEFAIMPHGARDDRTIDLIEREADDVLLPLVGATLRSALHVEWVGGGPTLDGEGLAFSACKESEDGQWLVLRCCNLLDREVVGRWCLPPPAVREARRSRLDETPGATIAIPAGGAGSIGFVARPREVVTILARPAE